jgi:hypothetical protein
VCVAGNKRDGQYIHLFSGGHAVCDSLDGETQRGYQSGSQFIIIAAIKYIASRLQLRYQHSVISATNAVSALHLDHFVAESNRPEIVKPQFDIT